MELGDARLERATSEMKAALSELFSGVAHSISARIKGDGLPLVETYERDYVRREVGRVSTESENALRNIFPSCLDWEHAPWLGPIEVAALRAQARRLAEGPFEVQPFPTPLGPGPSELIDARPDSAWEKPSFERDRSEWITRNILVPALKSHLARLPILDKVDEGAGNHFAEEVLRVAQDDCQRYLASIPLKGIELEGDSPYEFEGARAFSLLPAEQAYWHARDQRMGATLSTIYPEILITMRQSGPRTSPDYPREGPSRLVGALQLHGHDPVGRLALLRPDPEWMGTWSVGLPISVPSRSERRTRLLPSQFAEIIGTAEALSAYDVKQPRSRKELALHRFFVGASRENAVDAVLDYTISLEALLLPADPSTGRGDLSYRFRVHGAHYLAARPELRSETRKRLTALYSIRSKLVHGDIKGYPTGSEVQEMRGVAADLAQTGLLRATREGFPSHEGFLEMVGVL